MEIPTIICILLIGFVLIICTGAVEFVPKVIRVPGEFVLI